MDFQPANAHSTVVFDAVSIGTIALAIIGALPAVATVLAILWYVLQFYDRRTERRAHRAAEDILATAKVEAAALLAAAKLEAAAVLSKVASAKTRKDD